MILRRFHSIGRRWRSATATRYLGLLGDTWDRYDRNRLAWREAGKPHGQTAHLRLFQGEVPGGRKFFGFLACKDHIVVCFAVRPSEVPALAFFSAWPPWAFR